MCGRYEAGQKQKIAEAFHVSVTLDAIYFGVGVECAPGSIQPVIYVKNGERQVGEEMGIQTAGPAFVQCAFR